MERHIFINANKRYYLAIWKEMLGGLLGWAESQMMSSIMERPSIG